MDALLVQAHLGCAGVFSLPTLLVCHLFSIPKSQSTGKCMWKKRNYITANVTQQLQGKGMRPMALVMGFKWI